MVVLNKFCTFAKSNRHYSNGKYYFWLISESRPFTLVIDEFQNFLKINPSIFSDIQRDWDLHKRSSHLNLAISKYNIELNIYKIVL